MPLINVHLQKGVFEESRIDKISGAIQGALMEVLKIPADDFFQVIHELPKNRYRHTQSFVGMSYTDELITLQVTILAGRPRETRLALHKALNRRLVEEAGISHDDLFINIYEIAGENASFGRGEAQRAHISAGASASA